MVFNLFQTVTYVPLDTQKGVIAQGRLFLESSPNLKVVGENLFACVAGVCVVSQLCVYTYIYTHVYGSLCMGMHTWIHVRIKLS